MDTADGCRRTESHAILSVRGAGAGGPCADRRATSTAAVPARAPEPRRWLKARLRASENHALTFAQFAGAENMRLRVESEKKRLPGTRCAVS